MEETPYSIKVKQHLMTFDEKRENCDKFWTKYESFLEESPQALFDYGIYITVVKNSVKEGVKFISQSKNMMIENLKNKYKISNLKLGLDLSDTS